MLQVKLYRTCLLFHRSDVNQVLPESSQILTRPTLNIELETMTDKLRFLTPYLFLFPVEFSWRITFQDMNLLISLVKTFCFNLRNTFINQFNIISFGRFLGCTEAEPQALYLGG